MTHPTLASLIVRHIKKEGVDTLTVAAERIGITTVSLRNLLKHGRKPNARTFPAYARFLGVTEDELAVQLGRQDALPPAPVQGSANGDVDEPSEWQPAPRPTTFAALPLRLRERLRALSPDQMHLVGDFASWLVRRRPKAHEPVMNPRRTEAGRLLRARRIGRA